MIQINEQYRELMLEAIEDLMYKTSLQLNNLKGGPLTQERKRLTKKQKELEKIQHELISKV